LWATVLPLIHCTTSPAFSVDDDGWNFRVSVCWTVCAAVAPLILVPGAPAVAPGVLEAPGAAEGAAVTCGSDAAEPSTAAASCTRRWLRWSCATAASRTISTVDPPASTAI